MPTVLVVNLEKEVDLVFHALAAELLQTLSEFDDGNALGAVLVEDAKSSFGKEGVLAGNHLLKVGQRELSPCPVGLDEGRKELVGAIQMGRT